MQLFWFIILPETTGLSQYHPVAELQCQQFQTCSSGLAVLLRPGPPSIRKVTAAAVYTCRCWPAIHHLQVGRVIVFAIFNFLPPAGNELQYPSCLHVMCMYVWLCIAYCCLIFSLTLGAGHNDPVKSGKVLDRWKSWPEVITEVIYFF